MLSLTYVSTAVDQFDLKHLADMLANIRTKNHRLGITGLLLYHEGNIIQALEGPDATVEATFSTIQHDPRHRDITLILSEPIANREFPDWSMGFRHVRADELNSLRSTNGFSDFLAQPLRHRLRGEPSSVRLLLHAFRDTVS